jgi:hypothetical protein
MSEQEFKSVVIPCKSCAQDYELRLPMRLYDQMVVAHEALFGPPAVFTGTCPDCRADDPPCG